MLLGCLNTNRALQPLYADYLCSTDATYPGGDGYDLRTLVNPYGTGANVILAGGSNLRGVERAVERLLAAIAAADASVSVPFLFQVEVEPALAARLADWPYTSLADSAALQASRSRGLMFITEPVRLIGAYTLMWSWTADERYALVARDQLRALNERMTDGYGDWHYLAERFMRAIPHLVAGGFLTDADVHRTDHLLMLTALGNQDEWWRMRLGAPPLGHRHQGKGTYEFLLIARYLRDQAQPTPALRTLCDRWMGECCAFLDALGRGPAATTRTTKAASITSPPSSATRSGRSGTRFSPAETPGLSPRAASPCTTTMATAPARAATARARACTCSRRRRSRPQRARFITATAS